jgi:hypothetical protein
MRTCHCVRLGKRLVDDLIVEREGRCHQHRGRIAVSSFIASIAARILAGHPDFAE